MYLFYPNFARIRMFIPKIEEQKKIAKLLNLIDERIATQNKIIEDLKKLKSAIVEKVFCSPNQEYPMCRIEGFEQALSTYKMSDFSSRIATKNKDSKCSLVLTRGSRFLLAPSHRIARGHLSGAAGRCIFYNLGAIRRPSAALIHGDKHSSPRGLD